jgi:hypothetical protein
VSIFCQQKIDEKTAGGIVDVVLYVIIVELTALIYIILFNLSFPQFPQTPNGLNREVSTENLPLREVPAKQGMGVCYWVPISVRGTGTNLFRTTAGLRRLFVGPGAKPVKLARISPFQRGLGGFF